MIPATPPRARDNADGCQQALAFRNIRVISALEEQALARRTRAEMLGDTIAFHAGRLWFIVFHAVFFGCWVIWNSSVIPFGDKFDPFPYPALTTIVSLEAIFLSLFILMSQNRSTRRAEERAHLDLQVNLLAEDEATRMLRMLQALCAAHNLPEALDPEVRELLEQTDPAVLAEELERRLPSEVPGRSDEMTEK